MTPNQNKLSEFRRNFLLLTADGRYPPERQQQLFQAAQFAGLDWTAARGFIQPEAEAFYSRVLAQMTEANAIDLDELGRLRRRLGLGDAPPQAPIQVVVTMNQSPPRPATPKQRLLWSLRLTQVGLQGCRVLIVGFLLLIMAFALCMAVYYFAMAVQMMP